MDEIDYDDPRVTKRLYELMSARVRAGDYALLSDDPDPEQFARLLSQAWLETEFPGIDFGSDAGAH
jgi:hypothetical protein